MIGRLRERVGRRRVLQALASSTALLAVRSRGAIAATGLYHERHRPQFHFSPPTMWANDPNGLVYSNGEYHLFYQYHPHDKLWGPMHWGHAVSRDLIHWDNLPIALYPDEKGLIFSGSAVVDTSNSSGFGVDGKAPLVAAFTYFDPARIKFGDEQTQGLAYSNDNGRTWTKFAGNPVLPNLKPQKNFRDPAVFWHAPSKRWIMALAAGDRVDFYGSPNLRAWSYLSACPIALGASEEAWECPNLFPIKVAGSGELKWVLLLSVTPGPTHYFVGDFDGTAFRPDRAFMDHRAANGPQLVDWGSDNYAGVTWSNAPDDRRLFIGWLNNWRYARVVPTDPWRGAMTLPRELSLKKSGESHLLLTNPVEELRKLRGRKIRLEPQTIDGKTWIPAGARVASRGEVELAFTVPPNSKTRFGVHLSNGKGEQYLIGYDARSKTFFSDRRTAGDSSFSPTFANAVHSAPRASSDEIIRFHLFFDVASAELFADGGSTVMSEIYFPTEDFDNLAFFSEDGAARLIRGDLYELRSIW